MTSLSGPNGNVLLQPFKVRVRLITSKLLASTPPRSSSTFFASPNNGAEVIGHRCPQQHSSVPFLLLPTPKVCNSVTIEHSGSAKRA